MKRWIGMGLACWSAWAMAAELPLPLQRLPHTQPGPHPGGVLALQICLDRRGFSPNTLDGDFGRKTKVALATYCARQGLPVPVASGAGTAWAVYFPDEPALLATQTITARDVAALVKIPATPEGKAAMKSMGYETLQEMYAERGHLSEAMLRRLNPTLAWPNPPVGSKVVIPHFPEPPRKAPVASVLRVSLSRFEITAFDEKGEFLGLFPCSIAADKGELPPEGELQVKNIVAHPDYTYTPERVSDKGRVARKIFPPGPNNPVGLAWIGLDLQGYGIHGTPKPEQIGRAESHGCFRLANWNAVRLRRLCEVGTGVIIER
ncbi:MAG: L,D-transpeptidase family protein [Kiritimatiellia bacterium]